MKASTARQTAFLALRAIDRGAFADVELDRRLGAADLSGADRRLVTELVYGTVRRQRTLDALIDQLGQKTAQQQPADLRRILHLGLYQLRYLSQIPDHAVVDTTVELAKQNRLGKLAGVVNGLLRQYLRLSHGGSDPLSVPADPVAALGMRQSYPDWIIQVWRAQLPWEAVEQLCDWFNQPPHLDLRINRLQASVEQVEAAFQAAGIVTERVPALPAALRLPQPVGNIRQLPGYDQGWWCVQDSSAQLVGYLVDPQPGEVVIDACAAPGGKATHLAELMGDRGTVMACDRTRLPKLQQNLDRLRLKSLQLHSGDSRHLPQFHNSADRVLLDVPCSGLGTLNRHADARWRQTPESVQKLVQLQSELIQAAVTWVKPGGVLVYATCTLHPDENEHQVKHFLATHPDWRLEPPTPDSPAVAFVESPGWVRVWPHRAQMDGFFMAKFRHHSP
jgi:16S rRNA (cytosine967-C5)-methyltransferase